MTGKQLAAALLALPKDKQNLEVFGYDDCEEAYTAVGKPKIETQGNADYVKGDYPWYGEEEPDKEFIQI